LYIYNGPARSLNEEKLEEYQKQGIDNKFIKEAQREKEMITKFRKANKSKEEQLDELYKKTSAESAAISDYRKDEPAIKADKKIKKSNFGRISQQKLKIEMSRMQKQSKHMQKTFFPT